MSIESFLEAYPADSTFASEMAKRPEHGTVSPVRLMADRYIYEGTDGLREIHDYHLGAILQDNEEALDDLSAPYLANSSSIYFGITLRTIEDLIRHYEFNPNSYNDLVDFAFTGTGYKPGKIKTTDVIDLSGDDVTRIIGVAKKDKTFSAFFGSGIYSLPRPLQSFLDELGILKFVNKVLIPDYKERARLLIAENGSRSHTAFR